MLLASCGGPTGTHDSLGADEGADTATQNVRVSRTKAILYSIPSPMETASLLKKAGAEYQMRILNDVNNVNSYTSSSAQAINLGIYGADLSYATVYNHTNESMLYTSCARKLADKLGVMAAFNDTIIERMQTNVGDRDSLMDIISETYWSVDAYLKENDRDNYSALMIAGGWVEGLYIATQVAGSSPANELRQRIAEQKYSLNDLSALLGTYDDTGDPALAGVKADIASLLALYEGVANAGGATQVQAEDGVTVIGGGGPALTINDEQLAALKAKVMAIRNTYIN
jgi:hypothetical protein